MKVLIFGGTTEGRELSAALSSKGISVTMSVATDYGKNAAAVEGVEIYSDRLTEDGMISLLKQDNFDCVIDATHPYAILATQNICSACQAAGVKYFRLKRPESSKFSGVTYVPDVQSAVEILKTNNSTVLLTIGSKELEPFTHIENYAQRLFIRILPMTDSLEKALGLGFRGPNIICMQGPFDKEMNTATIKMTDAKFLVIKDSGDVGGFEAKVSAALSLGCEVIVITRPVQEDGCTFDELLAYFNIKENPKSAYTQKAFFPLFVDMSSKRVLVIGGGNVAERRIKILTGFGAEIIVISPSVTEYIERAASLRIIRLLKRNYKETDITDLMPFFVIAATDQRQVNHEVMTEAKSLNIQVSVADCREECTCYFPAIAENDAYIAGLISKNGDHLGVKQTAKKIREFLNS
ncbi:MAG: precorrin-6A reductase [Treponema sp.]|jgi:precorrin-2 dehydrogenase/sirohydrochlorin ferrochelatase/precorrin-6A/cobalt-precorrin-6A reductase|nr:precorrin-6A reductase [Treponema sp.]